MKKLLTLLACATLIGSVQSQSTSAKILLEFEQMKKNFSGDEKEWVFTKTIDAQGKSKDEIYVVALEVLAGMYNSSKDAIQNRDKDAGQIIVKGFVDSEIRKLNWASIARNRVWHLIKIEARDDRYRITLSINTIWNEQGTALGPIFAGEEYSLSKFYPYWKGCKSKYQEISFNNLKFAYDSSIATMDNIEENIAKKLNEDDNW
jgi:hypothetical protein